MIQALEFPNALSLLIYLIPPPQPNQYPPAHILDNPEIESGQKDRHNEDDHKAVEEESRQHVESQCRSLRSQNFLKLGVMREIGSMKKKRIPRDPRKPTLKKTWKKHVVGLA